MCTATVIGRGQASSICSHTQVGVLRGRAEVDDLLERAVAVAQVGGALAGVEAGALAHRVDHLVALGGGGFERGGAGDRAGVLERSEVG